MDIWHALNNDFCAQNDLRAAIVDPSTPGHALVEPSIRETLGIPIMDHNLFFAKWPLIDMAITWSRHLLEMASRSDDRG